MAQTLTETPPRSIDLDVRALLGSDIEALAQSECWLGVAKDEITPEGVEPLAGFSLSGSRGRPGRDRLWARALYLEDLDTGQSAVICVVDLLSASSALLEAVEKVLSARGRPDLVGRVLLSGTHTHTAPGRFFGNRIWGCRYTRDLRVVAAQLWGSLPFDSPSPVLLAIAIAGQLLSARSPWACCCPSCPSWPGCASGSAASIARPTSRSSGLAPSSSSGASCVTRGARRSSCA